MSQKINFAAIYAIYGQLAVNYFLNAVSFDIAMKATGGKAYDDFMQYVRDERAAEVHFFRSHPELNP